MLWNPLPAEICQAPSLKTFQHLLKAFIHASRPMQLSERSLEQPDLLMIVLHFFYYYFNMVAHCPDALQEGGTINTFICKYIFAGGENLMTERVEQVLNQLEVYLIWVLPDYLLYEHLLQSLVSLFHPTTANEMEAEAPRKRPKIETEAKEEYEEWKRRILESAAKSQRDSV